jgi:hypothetical protein
MNSVSSRSHAIFTVNLQFERVVSSVSVGELETNIGDYMNEFRHRIQIYVNKFGRKFILLI